MKFLFLKRNVLVLGIVLVGIPTLRAEEVEDPCSNESARNKIIEKLFADKESTPLVLDKKAKDKLLVELDGILAGKKPELSADDKATLKEQAKDRVCRAEANQAFGVESSEDYQKVKLAHEQLVAELKKKADRGQLSAETQNKINEVYQHDLEWSKDTADDVHINQQRPEVLDSARLLRKKLGSSNSLNGSEIDDLARILASSGNPHVGRTFMQWDYDTEKDPKTGEEYLVAYRAMYSGTSCMGYTKDARVTEMPSFKIPLKYFDRSKIGAWVQGGFMPGMGSWHLDSIPLKFASLGGLCPSKRGSVVPEGSKPAAATKTKIKTEH